MLHEKKAAITVQLFTFSKRYFVFKVVLMFVTCDIKKSIADFLLYFTMYFLNNIEIKFSTITMCLRQWIILSNYSDWSYALYLEKKSTFQI